ncbi:polysaccharide biosynthesis protein [Chlorobaculum limnaeum]|uniref:Polysaccharide biosynthesis protein n=1 Tax=Chlorobaculum limnaeum TaxID=274537 RepID=A0A1D8D0F4_CHLLM|nr:oligosaccharide flippase family protein [Chlorobaculum limnaeum]AOS82895.1 polysaccharide biosynthesis protein [Chlorobaculum limnaeum]
MLSKLKLLAKDTVIYGASTILARSLNYVLVPLYANKLTTFDNGIQAVVYANIALANVIFTYGLETSYLKVASDAIKRNEDERPLFSTAFFSLFVTSILFSALMLFFAPSIAVAIGLAPESGLFIRFAALILFLDTMLVVPFAELRLKRKAIRFALAKVMGVVGGVISTFVLILGVGAGLSGVFIGEALGSLVSLCFILPVLKNLKPFFSPGMYRQLLGIGLPYVPTGIAGLLIHLIDRNLLIRIPQQDIERLYGEGFQASDITGIYGRVAAFGVALQMFIQIFRFAWQPFFLQHADDPEAKPLFRQVMNLSGIAVIVLAVACTFFVPDLVRYHWGGVLYLLPPKYWMGLSILPWIFFSYVFDMISTNLSAGILITGNTKYLPVVTFVGAAVTSLGCWILIPLAGMDGAAVAILFGTAAMCLCMGWYSVRFYPVSYDWGRLALLLGAGLAFAVWHDELLLWLAGFGISGLFAIVVKLLIVLLYLALGTLIFRNEASAVVRMAWKKLRPAGGSGSR